MNAVELKDVTFAYDSRPILENVSLRIERESFCGIVGPNGAGKTTLINLISGVLRPTRGRIEILGRNLTSYTRRELAQRVAIVPQEYHVNFPFTVTEIVAMGRRPYHGRFHTLTGEDMEVVYQSMRDVGILELRRRPVTELSGGEWQMVMFARALAQTPEILILDEPTSNLDICHKVALLDLLRKHNKNKGLTVIAVMHDLNLTSMYCEEVVLLHQKRPYCAGETEEVFTRENLEHVFRVAVEVKKDSRTGRPQMMVLRGDEKAKKMRKRPEYPVEEYLEL